VRRVPNTVVGRFEENHRRALAAAGSDLSDLSEPAVHSRHLTFATGWWFAVQLLWRASHADDEESHHPREHLGFRLVPTRDSILLRLDSYLELSAATGSLGHLAEQTTRLRAQLVDRWGEPEVDVYPAFGGRPD
jgi:hypothetical protein